MQSWVAPTKLMYQGDKGYNQPFILTNAWQEYDVTADNLAFSARKPDGQVIEIENEPTRFVQKEGVWYFKLPDELTQAVGEVSCFFYVKDDTGIVASTTKFAYYVEAKFTESEISFSYVSLLEKLAKVFREYTDDAKNQVNELTTVTNDYKQKLLELLDKLQKQTDDWLTAKKAEIDADIKIRTDKIDALNTEYVDKYNELVNSWNAMISEQAVQYAKDKSDRDSKFKAEQSARATEFTEQKQAIASEFESFKEQYKTDRANRESDYQSQKVAIQNVADKQHDDIDKKFQELVQQYQSDKNARDTDYQHQLATILATIAQQRDQAISDAKADLQSQKETLQSDINEFKSNLESQVNSLSSQLAKTQTDADELNKILKAIKDQIDTIQSEITSVDFNSYLTKVDASNLYYDKSTLDQKLEQAGKVKTVDGEIPDSQGNITLDHYTKSETDQKITDAVKVKTVDGVSPDSSGNVAIDHYTKEETDNRISSAVKVKTVDGIQPDSNGNVQTDHYTKAETDQKIAESVKVSSVNGQTGAVSIDVGVTSINGQTGAITGIAKTSDIKITSVNGQTGDVIVKAGVTSVNGQTGTVDGLATTEDVTNLQNQITRLSENMVPYIVTDDPEKARQFSIDNQKGFGVVDP